MPNGIVHKTAGGILGPMVYKMINDNLKNTEEIDVIELILSVYLGISSSRIPDVLEPAINPNHRAFFHSLVFAGITGCIGVQAWGDLKERRNERKITGVKKWELIEFADIGLIIISVSILLHLIMDAFTPKGLPIL